MNESNTTQSLTAHLKDVQRSEVPEAGIIEKDTLAEALAKVVNLSISSDAEMQVLKVTLK